jgi:hypothetical protein
MPTHIFRNGKLYIEYTPQELDKLRLDREIEDMKKNGIRSFKQSVFLNPVSNANGGKKHSHI